ncbi:helix-turn-helix domain-containing protein [Streptomyces cyaneofuscatus]|uniref:helix-turn-helix domain-containing protein n=1 Tax=Streptomyces cyaneofuscatus TaxID=66883 RepID=UPI003F540C59
MTVLQALEEGRGPMSLTQIAAASGMQPSKAHRYLVSLARVGLVARPGPCPRSWGTRHAVTVPSARCARRNDHELARQRLGPGRDHPLEPVPLRVAGAAGGRGGQGADGRPVRHAARIASIATDHEADHGPVRRPPRVLPPPRCGSP